VPFVREGPMGLFRTGSWRTDYDDVALAEWDKRLRSKVARGIKCLKCHKDRGTGPRFRSESLELLAGGEKQARRVGRESSVDTGRPTGSTRPQV